MIELDNDVRVRVGPYNGGVMRKIAIFSLGVLALASPTAVGQEKPKVQGPEPKVERRFQWAVGRATREGVQARVELNRVAFSPDGKRVIYSVPSAIQPLMRGPFKSAVEELEEASDAGREGDPTKALNALDTVEKAAMKARRLLADLRKPDESLSENRDVVLHWDDARRILSVAGDGTVRVWNVNGTEMGVVEGESRTPLGEAQDTLELAVLSVRHAPDVESARTALEHVDKSTAALRALLWEKQSSKKN